MKAGLSADQLVSYESGRVPLPWIAGQKLCDVLSLSHRWLATGEGSMHPDHYAPVPAIGENISPSTKFSEAYILFVEPHLRSVERQAAELFAFLDGLKDWTRRINADKARQKKLRERIRRDPKIERVLIDIHEFLNDLAAFTRQELNRRDRESR